MFEILLIFSLLNFALCSTAVAIALYTKYSVSAQVAAQLYEAKAEISGVEPRLEKYLDKRMNDQFAVVREAAQNDALDLYKSLNSERISGPGSDEMGIASFRNL